MRLNRLNMRVSPARATMAAGLACFLGISAPGCAQTPSASPQAFARAYMDAIRSQDGTRLRALIHPATLACINNANRSYFDRVFNAELQLGASLQKGFKIVRITRRRMRSAATSIRPERALKGVGCTNSLEEAAPASGEPARWQSFLPI